MNENSCYDNYTQLLAKVDLMFDEVASRNPSKFECRKGCYGCCQSGLSVFGVEAARIRDWLKLNKPVAEKIKDPNEMLGDSQFCSFLDKSGHCSIYEVRPMICRSHGMPISWTEAEEGPPVEERDVCPLNFQGVDLKTLESRDVLSVDKLNILLSLINRQFEPDQSEERVRLEEIV